MTIPVSDHQGLQTTLIAPTPIYPASPSKILETVDDIANATLQAKEFYRYCQYRSFKGSPFERPVLDLTTKTQVAI